MGQRQVCTFRHALRAAYRTAISAAQILVSNYCVNCDFRFREVLLGNHKSYLDVAKIYEDVI